MQLIRNTVCFILASIFFTFIFGCSGEHSQFSNKAAFNKLENEVFSSYLTGDADQAKQSVNQMIRLSENTHAIDESSRAGILFLNYYRLYVLEQRCGNKSEADIALIRGRYWRIKNLELENFSDADIADKIESETPERIVKIVDDFDMGSNSGKLPAYSAHSKFILNAN
jgi:hypothetical protein